LDLINSPGKARGPYASGSPRWRRWLPWLGALIGAAALVFVLQRFDLGRFRAVVESADVRFILLVPLAIATEQLVRAWKWRQLLYPLRPMVGTLPLFGAIMAGYLTGLLIPFGFATLTRSWLVARREDLTLTGVLATVVLDRLTDGIVFASLVPIVLVLVAFPDPTGGIRAGLAWGTAGSFALVVVLIYGVVAYKRAVLRPDGLPMRLLGRLPTRLVGPVRRVSASFAEGIVWPREFWRGLGIVLASALIKLVAATHFLWAGLALGVALRPGQYLFLLVFLGFLVILGHFARVAGSFVVGAIVALGLFGVPEEEALAMVLIVEGANILSVTSIGAFALWRQGIALSELRAAGVANAG